jgi:hypothetical protein
MLGELESASRAEKDFPMKMLMIAATTAAILVSPAFAQTQGQTHPPHNAQPATPAAKVDCDAMAKKMGTGQQHSHAEEKGAVAHSAMNHEHMRCKAEKAKKDDKAK